MKSFFFFITLFLFSILTATAQTQTVKLEGQVVCCADCWVEADRTKVEYGTAEDLLKAKSCVEGGDPTLLAVRTGDKFELYQLEQGRFKLPGKNWLSFVGKKVAATGIVKGKKFRVDSLDVLAPSLAEREAQNVVGKEIELVLKDLSGAEQRLSALRGRIVILNFWATYCVPCREEMPDLAAIQNEYAALGVQTVGASADKETDRAKVLQFVKETKVNFPIWIGASAADTTKFGIGEALPGTIIINRDGKIVKVISGVVNKTDLKKQLDALLAETTANIETQNSATDETAREKTEEKPGEVSSVPS
jgi:thiol-disulfide isomerase/thioredoxin